MKQAMGRVLRYGQDKTVKIYHFVAPNTIDVDILEEHHKLKSPMVERDGVEERQEGGGKASSSSKDGKRTKALGKMKQLDDEERTRFVRDSHGKLALVPTSLLEAYPQSQPVLKSLTERSWKFSEDGAETVDEDDGEEDGE